MSSNLIKTFDRLCYGKQASDVFYDLLTVTLTQFCPPPHGKEEHAEAVKRLERKELINEFFFSLVKEYQAGIDRNGWCDPLGGLYMDITGQYKAQRMGQYFTPVHLCDLMAKMQCQSESRIGLIVNDPTCGSGRTLLAFHANCPGNYMFAEDLDPICCRMAVVNFAFHGCIGEVIQHNTLSDPKGLISGWRVANIGFPVPAVIPMKKEESFICSGVEWFWSDIERMRKTLSQARKLVDSTKEERKPDVVIKAKEEYKEVVEQLELFA